MFTETGPVRRRSPPHTIPNSARHDLRSARSAVVARPGGAGGPSTGQSKRLRGGNLYCKAQAPILSKLLDRYRNDGLVVVAPTQRYGYTVRRAPASPDEELRYIGQIRDTFYSFLRDEPVPVSEVNHTRYGVSTTPTLVLVDRRGIVRLYHPGNMTEEELRAAIEPVLRSKE
jgi:hypothetical protein